MHQRLPGHRGAGSAFTAHQAASYGVITPQAGNCANPAAILPPELLRRQASWSYGSLPSSFGPTYAAARMTRRGAMLRQMEQVFALAWGIPMGKLVKLSLHPHTLSPEIYTAIGEVVVAWSKLESILLSGIAMLLKTEDANAVAMASNMNISAQLDSALTLCHMVVAEPKRGALIGCLTTMKTMNTERNKIVHGMWQQTNKKHIAVCTTARAYGAPTEETQLRTPRSLANFTKQVRGVASDLAQAYVAAGLLVLPNPLPPPSDRTIAL
jgi:hypothetical protein